MGFESSLCRLLSRLGSYRAGHIVWRACLLAAFALVNAQPSLNHPISVRISLSYSHNPSVIPQSFALDMKVPGQRERGDERPCLRVHKFASKNAHGRVEFERGMGSLSLEIGE